MRSTFFGLNVALLALNAQRKALEVTAQNVANANTEGYSRQEAVMKAATPFTIPTANRPIEAGQIGTGVNVQEIRRLHDDFLEGQVRTQSSALGRWEVTRNYLEEIEAVINEPSDSGINALLTKFWGAWEDLANDPGSYGARAAVIQNANVLADAIRRDYQQFADLRTRADAQVELNVSQINSWLTEVADLNRQIMQVQEVGDEANDLRDQRDLLVGKIAQLMKIDVSEGVDGAFTVRFGDSSGDILVDGATALSLRRNGVLGPVEYEDGSGGWISATVEDGEIAGLLHVRDEMLDPTVVDSLANRLDELAKNLIALVNGYHTLGYGLDDMNGRHFFGTATTPSTGAADIAVNPVLAADPNKLGAASASGEPGNGEEALTIATALQTEQLTVNGKVATLGDWYRSFVTQLGIDSQEAQASASNQQLVVDRLVTRRESYSGVSLDEEATNLVRFERAYQAAARVMTAMDEMLDTLINGMGIVGR